MSLNEKLIRTVYFLGLVPLAGGLLIFFSWWIGKAWFLVTLHNLEIYGFYWIFISMILGGTAVLTVLYYLFRFYKTSLKKGLVGLACILINIPALAFVLYAQDEIEKRAYVRIYNKTDSDFAGLVIWNSSDKTEFRTVKKGDRKTRYYYPAYLDGDFQSAPLVDTVRLRFKTGDIERILQLPVIYKGECVGILIDSQFRLELKNEFED